MYVICRGTYAKENGIAQFSNEIPNLHCAITLIYCVESCFIKIIQHCYAILQLLNLTVDYGVGD